MIYSFLISLILKAGGGGGGGGVMLIVWDVMILASSFTRSMFKIFLEEEL